MLSGAGPKCRANEMSCFAVKVSLHCAKTRVNYGRRVRSSCRPSLSVSTSLHLGVG